jgi:hypothetical protein
MEFPVRYRSPRDVFAASSSFAHLHTLRIEEKKKNSDGGGKRNCTQAGKFTEVQVY